MFLDFIFLLIFLLSFSLVYSFLVVLRVKVMVKVINFLRQRIKVKYDFYFKSFKSRFSLCYSFFSLWIFIRKLMLFFGVSYSFIVFSGSSLGSGVLFLGGVSALGILYFTRLIGSYIFSYVAGTERQDLIPDVPEVQRAGAVALNFAPGGDNPNFDPAPILPPPWIKIIPELLMGCGRLLSDASAYVYSIFTPKLPFVTEDLKIEKVLSEEEKIAMVKRFDDYCQKRVGSVNLNHQENGEGVEEELPEALGEAVSSSALGIALCWIFYVLFSA